MREDRAEWRGTVNWFGRANEILLHSLFLPFPSRAISLPPILRRLLKKRLWPDHHLPFPLLDLLLDPFMVPPRQFPSKEAACDGGILDVMWEELGWKENRGE